MYVLGRDGVWAGMGWVQVGIQEFEHVLGDGEWGVIGEMAMRNPVNSFLPSGVHGEQDLRELLRQVDPDALHDSALGYKALHGVRLTRTVATLTEAVTRPRLLVLAVLLGGLRYLSKFLTATVHSVRVKAGHKGHYTRPPALDLGNPVYDPVLIVMQLFSNVLSLGSGNTGMLFDALSAATSIPGAVDRLSDF